MGIIQDIKEDMRAVEKEPTSRDLTILALLFLGILTVIGAYQYFWKGSDSWYYWVGVGVVLAALRLIPPVFRQLYRLWLRFSVILGYFISRIILVITFFVAVLPIGILMRMFGKDPMDRKLDPQASSYWAKREDEEDYSIERYERQF